MVLGLVQVHNFIMYLPGLTLSPPHQNDILKSLKENSAPFAEVIEKIQKPYGSNVDI